MRATTWRALSIVAPVGLLLVLAALVRAHGQLAYPDARFAYGDQYRYIAMAQHATSPLADEAPFSWRVLTPWLVSILPMPTLTAFWWVTLAGLAGATFALEWFLSALGLPRFAVVAGALAFVLLGPATGYALWAYTYADALPLFFLILSLGLAVRRRGVILCVVVMLGALAKETILLGAVFAIVWAWKEHDKRLLRWAVASCVSGLFVLAALRLLIPSQVAYSPLGKFMFVYLPPTFTSASIFLGIVIVIGRLLSAAVGTWMALLPITVAWFRHPGALAHWQALFLIVILGAAAQILVAEDVERLVAYGAPAIIAACAFEIESLASRWRVSRWVIWAPVLAVQAFAWLPYAGWPAPSHVYVTLGTLDVAHRLVAILVFVATVATLWPHRARLFARPALRGE